LVLRFILIFGLIAGLGILGFVGYQYIQSRKQ